MNDDFLSRLREEPRPEFAERLGDRLREIDARGREPRLGPAPFRRLVPAFAGVALAATVALAFTLEPVRAAALEFLDLFRVKRFAAVPVDPERLARLAQGGLDLKTLVADQVQVVVPPQEPRAVDSPEAGGVAAGIEVRQPAYLPRKAELAAVAVAEPGAFRVQLDTAKLEALAEAVGAEVEIPAWWNGATIDVVAPPVVAMRYPPPSTTGEAPKPEAAFVLLQSRTPEVELPEGFDLAVLGELGLRMAGLDALEARTFARSIDWRSTLLVPVPIQGQQYREVEVHGQKGLLVSFRPEPRTMPDGTTRRAGWRSVLMWSEGDLCFGLQGPGEGAELLEMAQSIR